MEAEMWKRAFYLCFRLLPLNLKKVFMRYWMAEFEPFSHPPESKRPFAPE